MTQGERYRHFLQKTVVRGKIVKVAYFQKQGLQVFLDKLGAHGWLELFTNTKRGWSIPELAKFYANCEVTNVIVSSSVHGKDICFDADNLGNWLGVPWQGFDVYEREHKNALGNEQLLDLTRKLAQKLTISEPRFVNRGNATLTSVVILVCN